MVAHVWTLSMDSNVCAHQATQDLPARLHWAHALVPHVIVQQSVLMRLVVTNVYAALDILVWIVIMISMIVARWIHVGMEEHVWTGIMDTNVSAGQSSLVLSVNCPSVSAMVLLVWTMEPAFSVVVYSLVAAFLASLDKDVKQRLMHVTLIHATMALLVTASSLLGTIALVLLDSLVTTVPQELTTVLT